MRARSFSSVRKEWMPERSSSCLDWIFLERRLRPFCGSHGIALGLAFLVLVGEEQRTPGFGHVPLDVVSQQVQKEMCFHPVFQAMADGANQ